MNHLQVAGLLIYKHDAPASESARLPLTHSLARRASVGRNRNLFSITPANCKVTPSPHISPVSAAAAQVLPWLRYVSPGDPQRVKNTPAVANLTCLATKGLKPPRDESDEICRQAKKMLMN
ncbi:MAG: hypothetical protein ABGX16_18945 [Pirellulales bacterium]